ncbi:MAG TPA: hypothetical protein VGR03_15530 [Candidatus Acidoferrum sp.]|nr:hypothetical protein [Candidatus Acidoferrum sp.]
MSTDTLGGFKASLSDWLGETFDSRMTNKAGEAVSDAVESLWVAVITTQISKNLGGPVSITLNAAAERLTLVSIADPTVGAVGASVAGGALAGRTYDLAYSLATESGSETNVTPRVQVVVALNNLCQVSAPTFVPGAFGWNLYFAPNTVPATPLARVNAEPIDFNQLLYIEPVTGWQPVPDNPFAPAQNSTADNIAYIRHLELLTPNGTYKSWNQADLDSTMFRRMAGSTASTSPYQNQAWDLVNGNTLEVRPAMGATQVPRYFYVIKPRRLAFDGSQIPFQNTPCASEFIRARALSRLCLSVYEYSASEMWAAIAKESKADVMKGLAQENLAKGKKVTPYMY